MGVIDRPLMLRILAVSFAGLVLFSQPVYAACSGSSPNLIAPTWADVAACHSVASNGDTITVSSGNYTVTTGTAINKFVNIVASGTVTLLDNTDGLATELITITESTAGSTKFAGFSITQGSAVHLNTFGVIGIDANTGGRPVLVTGITYTMAGMSGNFFYVRSNRGVLWNNTGIGVVGSSQCFNNSSFLRHKFTGGGIEAWKQPPRYGTNDTTGDNNLYVEGNTMNRMLEGVDWDDNARLVFRYNTVINSGTIAHGVDTSGILGGRYAEYYGNNFVRDTTLQTCNGMQMMVNMNGFIGIRGGTAIIHNNVMPDVRDGWWGEKAEVMILYENLRRRAGGYPCWNTLTAAGASYPAPHVPGWGYSTGATNPANLGYNVLQDLEPIYIFANTGTGNYTNPAVMDYDPNECGSSAPSSVSYVQSDREFYKQNPSFNGTSGTGSGPRSSRPGTCTAGVAYWSTDQGEWDSTHAGNDGVLDRCTANNSWTNAWYTPYPYPHPLAGGQVVVSNTDSTPPTPGNSGSLAAGVSSTAATLTWTKGSDNATPQNALQYEVRLSTNPDIGTVSDAESFGAVVVPYTTDSNTATIPGWQPGVTYYFNVLVKDAAGNKAAYVMRSVTSLISDTTPPTPGNGGLILASATSNSANLSWTKATDNSTPQQSLLYEVRRSSTANIDLIADAEANGAIVKAYTADLSSFQATALSPGTTYYFNVIVKDGAGNKSSYVMRSVTTSAAADTTPPVPGNSGQITSNTTTNSATIGWAKATDDVSLQSAIQYEVRRSNSPTIDTVGNAEANGVVVRTYAADITSFQSTGLNAGTTYYFNVIAKDGAGNKSAYVMRNVTTVAAADTTAPVPGNSGLITANTTTNSGTIGWSKATDDVSLQSAIQYEIRRSNSANIDTVGNAEANGVVVRTYAADITTFLATGLNPGTTYYYNVIAKDVAGNKSSYAMRSLITASLDDTTAPVPGNSGQITANMTSNSATLGWAKATDDVSFQAAIQYEVRRSTSANIETVANAEANGTMVKAYTADINAFVATGLTSGVTYFFNVIAKDQAGNKAAYTMRSTATIPTTDITAPVPGGGGQITASPNSNGVTLTWAKASDDVSPQTGLRYEIRLSSSGNIDTVANVEANGTIVKSDATDIATYTVTGLNSGTLYYFNIIVKDEASNKATYVMRSVTTTGRKPTQTHTNNGRRVGSTPTDALMADASAPLPGASGLITVSGVSSTGLTLVWTMATDNLTPQASLEYKVLRSSSENMNTITEAEANGTVLAAFTPNLNSYAVKNLANASTYYFTVVVKDEAGNKALYATAGDLTLRYSFAADGADSFATTTAPTAALSMNHARVSPATDTTTPSGVAVVRFAPGGKLTSEAGFSLTPPTKSGNAYVQITAASGQSDRVSTGIAFSNSSGQNADVSYSLVDATGKEVKTGAIALPANQQISAFLDESPFFAPATFTGTFRFVSTVPVTAAAMRGITKSTGQFLFSSLPLGTDQGSGNPTLPLFVDGGGWSTEVVLMNRSSAPQHGKLQFFGQGSTTDAAMPLQIRVSGQTQSTFDYAIPPQSLVRFITEGQTAQMANGSVRITADDTTSVPEVVGILSLKRNGSTVTESSISAVPSGTAFRAYAEAASGTQWVNSSVALVNTANVPNVVTLQLTALNGAPVGSAASMTLPAGGHASKFLAEIFSNLPEQFQGTVRITSTAAIGVSVFRCTYNAQGEFLYTPTPAVNETAAMPTGNLSFPMVAAGAGYNTQLVLFGSAGQAGTGDLLFINKDGVPRSGSSLGVAP